MTLHNKRKLTAILCVVVALSYSGHGQTNTEDFSQYKFNFNNPGARATGIGGAFISIADDATAAESNPAGITILLRPELSFEMKGIEFTKSVRNFAHDGPQSNYVLVGKNFNSYVISPSFASFVYPFRRINLTASAFRYELVNFESRFYTEGSYVPPRTDGATFFPATSELQLKAVNWGIALGYKVSEVLSVGVSGGLSTLDMQSTLNRYTIAVFDNRFRANLASIDDSQVDFFANVGVLVRPTEKLSFGATYKRRPSFDLKHTFAFGQDSVRGNTIHFNIPSAIGFGVSYRPTDVLTLAFDVDRVQYSSLTKDLVVTIAPEDQTAADFAVDDGMEYHFGAEYVWLLKSFGLVFRGGAFIEPDHRIRWVGIVNDRNLSPGDTRLLSRQASAALFQGGEADVHYTFGVGVIMSNNFQLDFAGDIADPAKEVVGSVVVRL